MIAFKKKRHESTNIQCIYRESVPAAVVGSMDTRELVVTKMAEAGMVGREAP